MSTASLTTTLPHENNIESSGAVSRRRWLVTGAALLGALTGVTYSEQALARGRVVALGEVDSKVRRSERWLYRALRRALKQELSRMDLPKASQDHYVLSVSLTQLYTKRLDGDERTSDSEAESTAVISAILRKAKGGALHAILKGKATAVDVRVPTREIELSALQAAVRSALRRVPEAIEAG